MGYGVSVLYRWATSVRGLCRICRADHVYTHTYICIHMILRKRVAESCCPYGFEIAGQVRNRPVSKLQQSNLENCVAAVSWIA